ncbi:hypothetical protein [Alkalibacillus silvisoli]|uniref:Uncharacterized protein n=1 Tax=Alkalibacillus silvisoli TaxID=392823 RepID=A0ABP3JWG7_9BACI
MTNDKRVQKFVKKYKKFYERSWVGQQTLLYNGKKYYMGFYQAFKKDTGAVFFTLDSGASKVEYREAFEWFIISIRRLATIRDLGEERRNINMIGFKTTKNFLESVVNEVRLSSEEHRLFQEGIKSISESLKLQDDLLKLMKNFDQFYNSKSPDHLYSTDDVQYLQRVNNEIDYIQYTQVKGFRDSISLFKRIRDIANNNSEVKKLTNHGVATYINEHCKGKESIRKNLDDITFIQGADQMNKDEYIDAVQREFVERQKRLNIDLMKELRFPNDLVL